MIWWSSAIVLKQWRPHGKTELHSPADIAPVEGEWNSCGALDKSEKSNKAARLGWLEFPGWDEGPTEYCRGETYGTWKAQRFCLLAVVAWQNITRTCNKTGDTGDTTNNEPVLCVIKMRSVCTISHTQTDWSSDTASKPLRFRSLAEYLPLVRLLFIESTHEVTDESWRPHQKRHMKAGFCFRFELSFIQK